MLRIPENRDLSHYFLRTPRNTNFQILSESLIFPSSHPRTSWTSRYRGLQEEGDRFALPSGIVSSKEPTARKSYVPRLFRWTRTDSRKKKDKKIGKKEKESIKRTVQREWPGPFAIISVTPIYLGDNHRGEFLDEQLSCPSILLLFEPPAKNLWWVVLLFSIILPI